MILREARAQRAFPAASIAVTYQGNLVALKSFGSFIFQEVPEGDSSKLRVGGEIESSEVTPRTLFDLASLTKPIATTTMAMQLYERGLLELDAPVAGIIPEFISKSDPRRNNVTFRILLAHSSGLPAYEKLFLKACSREELLATAFATPLATDPNSRAEYSDIGFILLGSALERLAGEPLDTFCQREIFSPLGMLNSTFNPPAGMRSKIPPTADEREVSYGAGAPAREIPPADLTPGGSPIKPRSTFRNRTIQGEVQDENASVLGGIAGHAGLFSTADDVARFAHTMLQGGPPILRPATVALFTHRQSSPDGTSRALGWDTPSKPSQSGRHFGPNSYGHLGYTGTSLWIDPDRQLSITLLTNRTWPDCSNHAIKQIRPQFHDAVVEALEG